MLPRVIHTLPPYRLCLLHAGNFEFLCPLELPLLARDFATATDIQGQDFEYRRRVCTPESHAEQAMFMSKDSIVRFVTATLRTVLGLAHSSPAYRVLLSAVKDSWWGLKFRRVSISLARDYSNSFRESIFPGHEVTMETLE